MLNHRLKLDLTENPFNQYTDLIAHKHAYKHSQPLGISMRQEQIEAFIYPSARTTKQTKNIAVYSIDAFKMKNNQYVTNQQTWVCLAKKQVIEFTRIGILGRERFSFTDDYFF